MPSDQEVMGLCPFCGCKPCEAVQNSWAINPDGGYLQEVWCQNCGVSGPQRRTAEEAIAAWNRRQAASSIPQKEREAVWPMQTHPMVFRLSEREGVLFDPQGKFHGWIMRQHPDGMWVSVRKLEAVDPEDNPLSRMFTHNTPPPMTMLCDLKADGGCASAGSDFCEYECPNRAALPQPSKGEGQ